VTTQNGDRAELRAITSSMVMLGMLIRGSVGIDEPQIAAHLAVRIADALMEELETPHVSNN
jgi:hypothetical protein